MPGTGGNKIYGGNKAPENSFGNVGDFYIDTTHKIIYGPKKSSGWGTGIAMGTPSDPLTLSPYGFSINPKGKEREVNILSGSGSYQITQTEESLTALELSDNKKILTITPQGIEGTSVITITDNKSGDAKTITVTITYDAELYRNSDYWVSGNELQEWRNSSSEEIDMQSDPTLRKVTSIGKVEKVYNNKERQWEMVPYPLFDQYAKVRKVIISDKVQSILNKAFYKTNITSVTIPNSVKDIGESAFASCKGLTSIDLPNSINSIDSGAFSGTPLISVKWGNSITSIGSFAFSSAKLTSVILPNSVSSLGDYAFINCKELSSVTLSNKMIKINKYTFSGCTSLKSIVIPNNITEIDEGAFYNCAAASSVVIGNKVASIGDYEENQYQYLAQLQYGAFENCIGLTSITIPKSVVKIGQKAFKNCDLTSITFEDVFPLELKGSGDKHPFYGNSNLTIYVPASAVEQYKQAWPDYAGKIKAKP